MTHPVSYLAGTNFNDTQDWAWKRVIPRRMNRRESWWWGSCSTLILVGPMAEAGGCRWEEVGRSLTLNLSSLQSGWGKTDWGHREPEKKLSGVTASCLFNKENDRLLCCCVDYGRRRVKYSIMWGRCFNRRGAQHICRSLTSADRISCLPAPLLRHLGEVECRSSPAQ